MLQTLGKEASCRAVDEHVKSKKSSDATQTGLSAVFRLRLVQIRLGDGESHSVEDTFIFALILLQHPVFIPMHAVLSVPLLLLDTCISPQGSSYFSHYNNSI